MGSDVKVMYCSFCGKSQHEVFCMVAGPTVFICDECTELCKDIVLERKKQLAPDKITSTEMAEIEVKTLCNLLEDAQRLLTSEVQLSRQRTNPMEDVIEKIEVILRPPQPRKAPKVADIQNIKPDVQE